ncbi:hypothetical protein ABZ318_04665 [Streptomyces sp. NPDC006197]|uniref:hypothetical protein n=1 Tax=Streptomyces sp. NPDC006197 TaxID=3156685 RepID=UPI00339EC70C
MVVLPWSTGERPYAFQKGPVRSRLRKLLPDDEAVPERTRRVTNRNSDPHGATEYPSWWETVEPLADLP